MRISFFAAFLFFILLALPVQAATTVHENQVWYRLHLGMGVGDYAVAPKTVFSFVDKELTPAFPEGFTITLSRGQWHSQEHGLIREGATVIDVQCADNDENWEKIEAIAKNYVERFKAAQASFFIVRIPNVTTTLVY